MQAPRGFESLSLRHRPRPARTPPAALRGRGSRSREAAPTEQPPTSAPSRRQRLISPQAAAGAGGARQALRLAWMSPAASLVRFPPPPRVAAGSADRGRRLGSPLRPPSPARHRGGWQLFRNGAGHWRAGAAAASAMVFEPRPACARGVALRSCSPFSRPSSGRAVPWRCRPKESEECPRQPANAFSRPLEASRPKRSCRSTLRWRFEVAEARPPGRLTLKAHGDFEGIGQVPGNRRTELRYQTRLRSVVTLSVAQPTPIPASTTVGHPEPAELA